MFKLRSVRISLFPLVGLLLAGLAWALPPGTEDEIRERLQPFGALCKVGDDCGSGGDVAASGPQSGEEVYNKFCFACHAAGVGGAPKFADAEQWAPRIDKGVEVLYTSTLNGINAMPMKGTCMDCSDDELKATVDYMVAQAK